MMQTQPPSEPTPENSHPDISQAFKDHLYKAELVTYGSLLVVGVTQIIIREQFPQIKPPWPWIVGPLMVALFGYIIIPPIITVMRIKKS
jgi:hypothetical protein